MTNVPVEVKAKIAAWSKSLRKNGTRHAETMAAWKFARSSAGKWARRLNLSDLMAQVGKLWDTGECGSLLETQLRNDLLRRGKYGDFVDQRHPALKKLRGMKLA